LRSGLEIELITGSLLRLRKRRSSKRIVEKVGIGICGCRAKSLIRLFRRLRPSPFALLKIDSRLLILLFKLLGLLCLRDLLPCRSLRSTGLLDTSSYGSANSYRRNRG
jgi:hypothetical protein